MDLTHLELEKHLSAFREKQPGRHCVMHSSRLAKQEATTPFCVNDSSGDFYKRVARIAGKKELSLAEQNTAFKARRNAQLAFEQNFGGCYETDLIAKIAWGVAQKECWKKISQYGKSH
ncbi:MAG: hypothetical protein K6L81_01810 [Agarilytica sp.]